MVFLDRIGYFVWASCTQTHLLVDPSFWVGCQERHVDIKRLLGKLVQNEVNLCVTHCTRKDRDFQRMGKLNTNLLTYLRCNHGKEHPTPHECMLSHMKGINCHNSLTQLGEQDAQGKKTKKFCIASLDEAFRIQVSKMPGVPIFFLSNSILMLQAPSGASKQLLKDV